MKDASTSVSEHGRVQQKARTRAELIRAARTLMDGGIAPTVDEAARAASVSRATAYRYFPSRRALLVAAYPQLTAESLLGDDAPRDPAARLDLVLDGITRQLLEHEPVLRTMLRLSLEARTATPDDLPFRVGRRIAWVGDALEPLRAELSEPDRERLVLAIASAVGIDALVWLTDVAGLSRPEAVELMCWSARTLLQAADLAAED
jgi:AcrR family transcriptional regulator